VSLVSVVVPARDAQATLGETISGLARQELAGRFEVIVVDDGSVDATAALAEASPTVTKLLRARGDGPATARNKGAAAARGQILAFLDSDCRPTPGWLAAGVAALEYAPLVQGRVLPTPNTPVGPFDRTLWVTRASGLFESANLFIDRDLFEAIGGFESWITPRRGTEMGEDVWLGWRARRRGARTAFCDAALVYHAVLRRGALAYITEQRRRRHFPEMASRIPELRDELFHRRYFLTARSMAFDGALAGLALAGTGHRGLGLLTSIPYLRTLGRSASGRRPREAGAMICAGMAADAVSAAALVRGSLETRSPVL